MISFYLRVGFAVLAFASAVLRGGIIWLVTRDAERVKRFVGTRVARWICWAARVQVRLHGGERLAAARGAILVPNQQSIVCYGILANAYLRVPRPLVVARFVGRWNIPIMTPLFEATGNILVDGSSTGVTRRGLERARAALRDGCNIFMFPEGTRWGESARLGPFKRGAFALASESDATIIPIVVSPLRPWTDLPRRRMLPHTVDVHVLEPISARGYTRETVAQLQATVAARMQEVLSELARERGLAPD